MRRTSVLRRATVWTAAGVMALAVGVSTQAATSTTYTHGYDVSWPQCSSSGHGAAAAHMPSSATYVILGLTHGAGHTVNPCLGAQLSWAKAHHAKVGAYLVPSYPTTAQLAYADAGPYGDCSRTDTMCRAGNDGAKQAREALRTMSDKHMPAPMVWVDVEFRHVHPWSHNQTVNARVVAGVIRGLQLAKMPFGVYTTSYMWSHIVGGYRVNAPNWLPAGSGSSSDAKGMCRTTGSGGTTWIAQYTRTFDENLTCPVMDAVPGRPGPLWRYRTTTLSVGASGPAVVALQKALGVSNVTGSYDAQTVASVVSFQVAKSLPVNGQVDRDDWTALGAFRLVGGHPFLLPRVVAPVS